MIYSGLLVGLVGLCGVELHYTPPSAWLTLGVLLASGLTLALLNLYFQVISSTWLTTHTGRLTVDLAEVVDYLRVVSVRWGHLDGHDRLLPGGQPRAGLGLGEGEGEQSVMLVVAMVTVGHLPGGQDGGGGVGRRGDLAKVLDGLGGHRYLAGHLSHRFISYLRPNSFCDVLERKKTFLVQLTALQNMQIWKGRGMPKGKFSFLALVKFILGISLFCCPPKSL